MSVIKEVNNIKDLRAFLDSLPDDDYIYITEDPAFNQFYVYDDHGQVVTSSELGYEKHVYSGPVKRVLDSLDKYE